MAEKRKKRVEERRRINAESAKYSSCIFVDKDQWEQFGDCPGLIIVDNDGNPVAKYENMPIEEDENIFYLSQIKGELAYIIWAEDKNEEKEEDSEGKKKIIVLDDDNDEVLDLDNDEIDDNEVDLDNEIDIPFVKL